MTKIELKVLNFSKTKVNKRKSTIPLKKNKNNVAYHIRRHKTLKPKSRKQPADYRNNTLLVQR